MLKNKNIAIVGGTSGIGRALSIGIAEQGARVFTASRSMDKVEETVAAVKAAGGDAVGHEVDVRDPESIDRFAQFVKNAAGQIDGLVNCAGITIRAPAVEVSLEDFAKVIEVNLQGTFLSCQTFGRIMIAQGSGRIVNIGSMSAYVAIGDVAPYCASKGAVKMLTKALASEWAKHGVAVNTLHPGFFITELNKSVISEGMPRRLLIDQGTPMGRVGEVEELVGGAVYLLSDAAGFVTGTDLVVDGGFLANGV